MSMQTVTYSDARENLKAVLDKVVADRAPTLITRQRGENVVLISASEWAGMEETLHLLSLSELASGEVQNGQCESCLEGSLGVLEKSSRVIMQRLPALFGLE